MINTRDVETFYNQYPNHVVMNHYGPTETTIGSVFKVIDPEHLNSFKEYPVIGTPIHNTNAYVLDENMKLLPEGVYGELCIAGAGVTGGYVNKPDITKEKFVEDPFAPYTKNVQDRGPCQKAERWKYRTCRTDGQPSKGKGLQNRTGRNQKQAVGS